MHVLTFFLKLCQSGDRGKGLVPSTASTKKNEYISDEEIFDSTDPFQTIELSLRKANREFRDLVAVGPETTEVFQTIAELCVKIENYGVSHVI